MNFLKQAIVLGCFASSALSLPNSYVKRDDSKTKFEHVILLSFDGLHQKDVDAYVSSNPKSAIATLLKTSVEFTNAQTSKPSDSFPGLTALVSGGSPKSTGVFYDVSYDRTFFAPGSNCTEAPGAVVAFDETIDFNSTALVTKINPANLPKVLKDGKCVGVLPHEFIKVNTIFEVAKKHGFGTAWTDKHPAYDLVNGPSGKGVDDLYTPEINSVTTVEPETQKYDQLHLTAILNWIKGVNSTGGKIPVPGIMGGNFQAVSVSQKDAAGGYLDDQGKTPSTELKTALTFLLDSVVGQVVKALDDQKLTEKTLFIISAKHGQSPINKALLKKIPAANLTAAIGVPVKAITSDDVALIWLASNSDAKKAVDNLSKVSDALGILKIFSGDELAKQFGDPTKNSRTPDVIVQTKPGVIYTTGSKIAEHGGFNEDDIHVPIIISNPKLKNKVVDKAVTTAQVAPTILEALGIKPEELEAVVLEKVDSLPVS